MSLHIQAQSLFNELDADLDGMPVAAQRHLEKIDAEPVRANLFRDPGAPAPAAAAAAGAVGADAGGSPTMSPEEAVAKLPGMLNYGADRYMLDFGPFAELEARLRQGMEGFSRSNPDVADFVGNLLRECLHEAVEIQPSSIKFDKPALEARLKVLADAEDRFMKRFHQAEDHLQKANIEVNPQYLGLLKSEFSTERARIEEMVNGNTPLGLTGLIIGGASLLSGAISKVRKGPVYTGSARDWRNRYVADNLERLTALGDEFKKRVGDKAWEEDEGRELLAQAKKRFDDVAQVMAGAERQGDVRSLKNRLEDIQKTFYNASQSAITDELKEAVESLMKGIKEFLERVKRALGIRLDTDRTGEKSPEATQAARPRPV